MELNSIIRFLALINLLLIEISFNGASGACNHQHPRSNQIFHGIEIDPLPHGSRMKRSLSSPLRIHFEYTESFNSYTGAAKIKNNIMDPSRFELESLLRAKNPTNGILRVNRQCTEDKYHYDRNGVGGCAFECTPVTKCLSTTIPESLLKRCRVVSASGDVWYSENDGEGIKDVDIILLVSVEYCAGDTYAHAGSCFSEKELDRPILGIVNLCHGVFSGDKNVREAINLVKHEIIHTLGFSVEKYAFFRYPDGSPIVPRNSQGLPNLGIHKNGYYNWNDKITTKVVRTRYYANGVYQKTFDSFVLPNVVEVAKKHFNCPSIDAVDLEDFGGKGSELTHFDEYFLYNEIMTAETNKGIDALSKFTLALLKDTGWYESDYALAEEFLYGNDTGCVLPFEGCYKYMEHRRKRGKTLDPFCDRIFPSGNVARCSPTRKYYDYCHLTRYNSLLKEQQYFKRLKDVPDHEVLYYSGKSEYNEFCPSKIVFSNPSSVCSDEYNNARLDRNNAIQSYFGPDSLCFENALVNYHGRSRLYGASCQRYEINEKKTSLVIYYGSQSISCPSKEIYHLIIDEATNVTVKCPENLSIFPLISFPNMALKLTGLKSYHLIALCLWKSILCYT